MGGDKVAKISPTGALSPPPIVPRRGEIGWTFAGMSLLVAKVVPGSPRTFRNTSQHIKLTSHIP